MVRRRLRVAMQWTIRSAVWRQRGGWKYIFHIILLTNTITVFYLIVKIEQNLTENCNMGNSNVMCLKT